MSTVQIQHFFDPETYTLTYVVSDLISKDAIIIDPVLDFDPPSGTLSDHSAQKVVDYINHHQLTVKGILETHAHADHLSSSQLLKQLFPKAVLAIGARITFVQETFKSIFNIDYLETKGQQFDHLFGDFEVISFGTITVKAIPSPGHTPACMSYLIADAVFSGDALFMPDYGTGRCDFPQGSARDLYRSVRNHLYSLPDNTRVFVGHDYSPNGREMKFETTIGESKKYNIQLGQETSEAEFIQFRETRDKTLKAPRLLLPSIQVNIDAGKLPPKEDNQVSYLKLPLKLNSTIGRSTK